MIRCEFHKLFSERVVAAALLTLLVLNALVCFGQVRVKERELPPDALEEVYELFLADEEGMTAAYENLIAFQREQEILTVQRMRQGLSADAADTADTANAADAEPVKLPNRYAPNGFTDRMILAEAMARIGIERSFREKVEGVIRDARRRVVDYESRGETGFLRSYAEDVILVYSRALNEVSFTGDFVRGWDKVFSYDLDCAFLFLSVLVIAVFLFTHDFSVKFVPLLRSTQKGRMPVFFSKLAALLLSVLFLSVLFRGEVLLIVALTNGLGGAENAIQTIGSFAMCPFAFSICEGFFFVLLFRTLGAMLFAGFAQLLCTWFRGPVLSLLAGAGGAGLMFLAELYAFPRHENPLSLFNALKTATARAYFEQYRAVRLFEIPLPSAHAAVVFSIFALLFSAAVSLFFWSRCAGQKKRAARIRLTGLKPGRAAKRAAFRSHTLSLAGYEAYKLFFAGRTVLLILALMLAQGILIAEEGKNPLSFSETVYKEYFETLAGPVTDEKRTAIRKERAHIADILGRFDDTRSAYIRGELSADGYQEYLKEYARVYSRRDVFTEIESRLTYLERLAARGKEGWFVYDTGWLRLFSRDSDWLLYGILLLFGMTSFGIEFGAGGGFAPVLRAAKHGRRRTFSRKYMTAAAASVVMSAVWIGAELLTAASRYPLPMADAPARSFEIFGEIGGSITVGQAFALYAALRIAAGIVLVALVCSLSALLRGPIPVALFSVVLTALPGILKTLGVSVLRFFDFSALFRATPLITAGREGWILIGVFAALPVFLTAAAAGRWNRTAGTKPALPNRRQVFRRSHTEKNVSSIPWRQP